MPAHFQLEGAPCKRRVSFCRKEYRAAPERVVFARAHSVFDRGRLLPPALYTINRRARRSKKLKERAAHPVQAGTGGAIMLSGARQAGLIVIVIVIVVIVVIVIVIVVIVIVIVIVIVVVIVVAIRLAVVV